MTKVLLKLMVLVGFGFTLISLLFRSSALIQPVHPTLRGFTDECANSSRPCWYGIQPGVTSIDKARATVERIQYPLDCVSFEGNADILTRIDMRPCEQLPPLNLGEVVNVVGGLRGITLIADQSGIIANVDTVVFRNPYVTANIPYTAWRLHRWQALLSLTLTAEPITTVDFQWYGAVPTWRLCQLEPGYLVCGFCALKSSIEVYDANNICR